MLTDYFFWFVQPATALNQYDRLAGYLFAGMAGAGLLLWLARAFAAKHPVVKKLMNKLANVFFWTGLLGLVWFGFRYQAIPIFSKRAFAGGVILLGLVWLGFVGGYLVRRFPAEKKEYDYDQVKSKYIR